MKILINRNSEVALKTMGAQNFVHLEDMIQLGQQFPEVWLIAARILELPHGKDAYTYIKYHRIESTSFVPAVIKGLEDMYENTLTGDRMRLNIAMGEFISSFTKKDLVWVVIIAIVLSAVALLIQEL